MKRNVVKFIIPLLLLPILIFSFIIGPMSVLAANSWVAKQSMTTARYQLGAASLNGKVYVVGGWQSGFSAVNKFDEYDPSTNTWAVKSNMLTPRDGHGVATENNKIYAIGGSPFQVLCKR